GVNLADVAPLVVEVASCPAVLNPAATTRGGDRCCAVERPTQEHAAGCGHAANDGHRVAGDRGWRRRGRRSTAALTGGGQRMDGSEVMLARVGKFLLHVIRERLKRCAHWTLRADD